jgi:hypothetical protein
LGQICNQLDVGIVALLEVVECLLESCFEHFIHFVVFIQAIIVDIWSLTPWKCSYNHRIATLSWLVSNYDLFLRHLHKVVTNIFLLWVSFSLVANQLATTEGSKARMFMLKALQKQRAYDFQKMLTKGSQPKLQTKKMSNFFSQSCCYVSWICNWLFMTRTRVLENFNP